MKQATLVIILVALVALGVGFFGGQALLMAPAGSSGDDIAALRAQVQALSQKIGTGGTGTLKIAYVDMFKALKQYSVKNPDALNQFQQKQQEIQQQAQDLDKRLEEGKIALDKQLQEGKITKVQHDQKISELQAEHDQKINELQVKLQQVNLQLTAPIQDKIRTAVIQIAQDKGYALVLDNEKEQLQPIVVYAQAGQVDDITDQVIEKVNAQATTNPPGK